MRLPLPNPALMLVTDTTRLTHASQLDRVIDTAVSGGVNVVQLREKHLPTAELVELGARVREVISARALLFVNGDIDAAIELRAEGVHLPAAGAAVIDAAARCGDRMLVSRAVHSIEAAVRAERDGADLIVLGTVFASASHPEVRTLGLDGVRAVCGNVGVPVIAIGGVTRENAGDVLRAGASGVAVISAIFDAVDPRDAALSLREALAAPARA